MGVSPIRKEGDDVRDKIDISPFAILRRANDSAGVARPNANHCFFEVDIAPPQRKQFALPHARFERKKEQGPGRLARKMCEEPRKLMIFEVRGLLSFRSRPLSGRKFSNRV
jgi:hypothetical protein